MSTSPAAAGCQFDLNRPLSDSDQELCDLCALCERQKKIISANSACPACPVAPADGTGVAPGDGTGARYKQATFYGDGN